MPMLDFTIAGDAFADGAGDDRFLLDLSEQLSSLYGKMVRQGQVFRIRRIQMSIFNPNTPLQDEVMAAAGRVLWFHPTGPRKKAWRSAFKATQVARRGQGAVMTTPNYDFRVGFMDGYESNNGVNNQDGVKWNAWLNADDEPLMLHSSYENQSIFQVYNTYALVGLDEAPRRPGALLSHGFGSPFQKDADAILDPLDYTTADHDGYFLPGAASFDASSQNFQMSFTSLFESNIGATEAANSVSGPATLEGPIDCMCGLLAIHVDTTTVDDSAAQSQDWGVRISVDVESWTPIVSRKSRRRKGRKK